MLGAFKMVSLASWGSGASILNAKQEFSATILGHYADQASYEAKNNRVYAGANWDQGQLLAGNAFDQTGVVENTAITLASTFKLPTGTAVTWRDNEFVFNNEYISCDPTNIEFWAPFSNQVRLHPTDFKYSFAEQRILRNKTSGNLGILWDNIGYSGTDLGITYDSVANTWITVVTTMGTTAPTGWSGGTPGAGEVYLRHCVINTETKEVLSTVDSTYSFFGSTFPTTWSSDTIRLNYIDSTAGFTNINCFVNGNNAATWTDYPLVASGWYALGEAVDTHALTDGVENYKYFCSPKIPETVGGVRAWTNLGMETTVVDGIETIFNKMSPARATTTNSVFAKRNTGSLTLTPLTSTDIIKF